MAVRVGLSTASVWPRSATSAFESAATLGYDGVEVMVWADPISQDPVALKRRSVQFGVPVLAVHAPCLLITQRVWSPLPEERLKRSVEAAAELDAPTVVIHPPFRWQRRYADGFADLVAELEDSFGAAGVDQLALALGERVCEQHGHDVLVDQGLRLRGSSTGVLV